MTAKQSKYIDNLLARLTGLISTDYMLECLPKERALYRVGVTYRYYSRFYRFDGEKLRAICIHLINSEECEIEDCPFYGVKSSELGKENLLVQYPNIDLSKYCNHYKAQICRYCFPKEEGECQRCICGENWFNCESCVSSDGGLNEIDQITKIY